ncbi:MAG: hypothetical protein IPQ07_33015 [Myxococcales bacterium]|nr:hypothetical protein [Myxococcales bacterium]
MLAVLLDRLGHRIEVLARLADLVAGEHPGARRSPLSANRFTRVREREIERVSTVPITIETRSASAIIATGS